jgi:hypothetical protein
MQLPIFVSKIVSKHFQKYRYSQHMLNDLKIKSLKPREELYRVADHSGLCIEIRLHIVEPNFVRTARHGFGKDHDCSRNPCVWFKYP